jgi:hypothetical protein
MKYFTTLLFVILTFGFISCEEGGLLIESDISNETVVLIAPSDSTEVSSSTIFFDWEALEDATHYEIQIATPGFNNTQQLLLNSIDSLTFKELQLNTGDYQWRVKAMNSNYETQYTTASFKVTTIDTFSDNMVLLISPPENLITNSSSQNLQWQPVNGANLYRIRITDTFGVLEEELTSTNTNVAVTFPEGDFIWKVRAENETQNTLYSSRNILVDLTQPNTPILSNPENGETLTSQQVSFEWTRASIEGSVETDSIYVYRDMGLLNLVLKDLVTSPYETTLTNDTYYWFVKSFDEAGNESIQSSIFSFEVNE